MRTKRPRKKLKTGKIYLLDRRQKSLLVYKTIKSRQDTANVSNGNSHLFKIRPAPDLNTIIPLKEEVFFGKEYVKIIASNKNEMIIGYILFKDFKLAIRGKLLYVNED